jgi:sugar lactone lactonase YvrE
MNRIIILLLSFYLQVSLISQSSVKKNSLFVHQSLKQAWTTEKQFATPESVLFYEKNNVLFVSNVNGQPAEKDNNGFITKMSTDGKIIQLKWAQGLSAPKGMGIYKDKLYVTDIDHLVEIDLKNGNILKKHKGKKARFLNDIAVGKDGTVYVSDMKNNIIYALKNGVFDIWLRVGNLFQPNGLLVENERLLVGCMNYVVSVDLKTKHVRTYITETGSIDGLVKNGEESYIISDWVGNIHAINKNAPKLKLLSTEQNNVNAADIEYIKSKKLLIVPTFFDNRVMAYKVDL